MSAAAKMHKARLSPELELSYRIDDSTDPWTSPETVVFVHGLAESSVAWRAWVPHFSRRYRTVRVDLRGFGESTPMPVGFPWTLDVLADDLAAFATQQRLQRFHMVSAKLGGTVAMRFAAKYPHMLKSLSVVSSPVSIEISLGPKLSHWERLIETVGTLGWARETMGGRLGSDMAAAGQEWWADMMGATPHSTMVGIMRALAAFDVTSDLPYIRCPTLVVTSTGSLLGSVDAVKDWQRRIADSQLLVLDSDSYHIAASSPDACAEAVRAFIDKTL